MNGLNKLYFVGWLLLGAVGCSALDVSAKPIQDQPLEGYRTDLLDRAYDVASAMPINPHIKDRSRAQEKVLRAALELDQPVAALRYAKGIANWRRGKGFADYAYYSVEHGATNGIPLLLQQAESIAGTATQEWRRDTVMNRINQVNHLLQSRSAHPETPNATAFEERFAQLDAVVLKGGLDDAKGVVNTCLKLYEEFYNQADFRARLRKKIEDSWTSMPVFLRMDCLEDMALIALENKDRATARDLADEAMALMDGNTWPVEYSIPLAARFAAVRFQSGDEESARAGLADALRTFKERQNEIVDIDRAETLVPVAEASVLMGDPGTAAAVYSDALDAAVHNANSRPRAADISMICVSMALRGFEPDVALINKLDQLCEALGDPW